MENARKYGARNSLMEVSTETPVFSFKLMPDSMRVCLTDVHSLRTTNVYV